MPRPLPSLGLQFFLPPVRRTRCRRRDHLRMPPGLASAVERLQPKRCTGAAVAAAVRGGRDAWARARKRIRFAATKRICSARAFLSFFLCSVRAETTQAHYHVPTPLATLPPLRSPRSRALLGEPTRSPLAGCRLHTNPPSHAAHVACCRALLPIPCSRQSELPQQLLVARDVAQPLLRTA